MWWGDAGPELDGFPFWPQKRTVRSLIRDGVLKWSPPHNRTQDECGIYPIVLAEEWKEVIPMVAVLARKRAEPLLVELIAKGNYRLPLCLWPLL
jgi:hypothetical protein